MKGSQDSEAIDNKRFWFNGDLETLPAIPYFGPMSASAAGKRHNELTGHISCGHNEISQAQ